MVNAYSTLIKNKFVYCSDSNGYWRFQRLETMLENDDEKCAQILTHPVWWTPEIMTPADRIKRCFYGRAQNNYEEYCQYLTKVNRKNIET